MKLNELTPKTTAVRSFQTHDSTTTKFQIHPSEKWESTADEYAAQLGFKSIGSGHYSRVYMKPNLPYIIKIFSNGDTNYISWVKWCRTNAANPYVPKFRGAVTRINHSLSVIRIERLTEPNIDSKVFASLISGIAKNGLDGFKESFLNTKISRFNNANHICKFYPHAVLMPNRSPNIPVLIKSIQEDLDLKQICLRLYEFGPDAIDLHPDNIMMRGDQIVIIDPVYTRGTGF